MTSFNQLRGQVYDQVQRVQYYRDNLRGLSAYDRHNKFISDYLKFYGDGANQATADQPQTKTDHDVLREHHRFIRSEQDDASDRWEVRLARKYYERLFKEYAIVDLSRYKERKLGMRWRTQKEVISGKGQFMCAAKGCDARDGLCSYEVPFGYQEAGQRKHALVKLRLCPACAYKLNYHKEKQYAKAQARKRRSEERDSDDGKAGKVKKQRSLPQEGDSGYEPDVAPPPNLVAAQNGHAGDRTGVVQGCGNASSSGGVADSRQQQLPVAGVGVVQPSVLPADDSVWEQRPVQEATVEEEFDQYFEGMFL